MLEPPSKPLTVWLLKSCSVEGSCHGDGDERRRSEGPQDSSTRTWFCDRSSGAFAQLMAGVLPARPRSPRVERASWARVLGGWGNGPGDRAPAAARRQSKIRRKLKKSTFSGEWTTKEVPIRYSVIKFACDWRVWKAIVHYNSTNLRASLLSPYCLEGGSIARCR